MGLMDQVGGLLGGDKGDDGNGGGKGGGLLGTVMGMLGSKGGGGLGGLGNILGKFNAAGLGDKVSSWISTGPNKDVSGDEVEQALGAKAVKDIADEAGVSHEEAKGGLAKMLPGIIDKLTPDGKLPGLDQLGGLLGGLKGKLPF